MKTQEKKEKAIAVAQFRFSLIAPVIQDIFSDANKTAYYKRISKNPFTLPDGSIRKYSYKTIEEWEVKYKKGGFNALIPSTRSDYGTTRALSDEAIQEIYRVKNEFPRLNATQIHKHLIAESFIPALVSVDSVQRFIKKNDLKSARNPNIKDRKAFEEDSFGKMWQADTCFLPHITEDGKSRRVYCVMIIDDHSRMLVGGELFYNDNAQNFQKVLKDAVSSYGVPSKLYVDNGGPYSNIQLSLICGSLGTVLLHTKVRDGASKAKIERHFRTLKERWLYKINPSDIASLSEFNESLKEYMREYNVTFHTGINATPYDRYKATRDSIKIPPSSDWLNECFLNRITRKVRNDATITIDKVSYDVPMQFIGATVEIRYEPSNPDSIFIFYDNTSFPIRKTNKTENCRTKRSNNVSIDYSKIGGTTNV